MIIYIGADHRGFELKKIIIEYVKNLGYSVSDLGNSKYEEDDDYPDFAAAVAAKVSADPTGSEGIVICGSGVGVDVVANKFRAVRSALSFSPDQAGASKADDATNVLALPADFLELDVAKRIVSVWLQTPISTDARYKRRLDKIRELEQNIKNQ
jgi:ribose 5-phosphate isomerase B